MGLVKTAAPNEYKLRVYTGAFAGRKTARIRAQKEIPRLLAGLDYESYEIIDAKRVWFPSHIEFIVRVNSVG